MSTRRLVRDALLILAVVFPLAGAVNLTLRSLAPVTGEWDVALPNRAAMVLLYLIGFGFLAVLWLSHRQPSRSSLDPGG